MQFYEIRPINEKDISDIHAMRLDEETMDMLEAVPTQMEGDCMILLEGAGMHSHCLVAETVGQDGQKQTVGMVLLVMGQSPRKRHAASIGITVHKNWQGQGIGKALLKTILDFSDKWLRLVRIDLDVFVDNARAIALYESFGFEKEGLCKKAVLKNGEYCDFYKMARIKENFA